MGLFDNVKDSIKGSDSQNNGDGFDSSEFDSSFTSDNSGSEMNDDPLGSPQNNQDVGADPVNDRQGSSGQGRNSLEPSDPLEDMDNQGQRQGNNRAQNDFQPQNDLGGGRENNNSPNPRAGRPEEGGSSPQLSNDTKEKMEQAGFNLDNQDGGGRGRGQERANRQNRGGQKGFDSQQGSVANNRDDFEEIKSQNQQIIELLKRISDALNSGQGGASGSGRNRHGGRR